MKMEDQFISAFKATLEPDATVIRAAERHIQDELHTNAGAGIALLNITFADAQSIPLAIRQAAAVNLSKWIKERWSPFFSEFIGFPVGGGQSNAALAVEMKPAIRSALLNAFGVPEKKLRGPLLKALINIASCDWPDEFPDLLPTVSMALQQDHDARSSSVGGALSFLDEWFYTSMDETSLLSITRELFPQLEIILSKQAWSAQIRCHCISILNQTLETLWMVKEQYPEAAKSVAQELLPRWLTILEGILDRDPADIVTAYDPHAFTVQAGEQLALQAQAWQTLGTATHFGSHFKPRLVALQARAFASLASLEAPFDRFHLSQDVDADSLNVEGLTFFSTPSALAGKVVDFLGVIIYKSRASVDPKLVAAFVPLLLSFSRITAREQEEWLENISSFVTAGEDDEMGGSLNISMRGRCADVLAELSTRLPKETLSILSRSAAEMHARATAKRASSEPAEWWKEEEAALALIGGIAEFVNEENDTAVASGSAPYFDLPGLFTNSVLPYMSPGTTHFLYGRCFVFASQFASSLPTDMTGQFLQAAVQVIESDAADGEAGEDLIVKLSAVRCIKNFHRHLSAEIVQPFAARILARLAPLLSNADDDVLVLIIETLQAVAAQRSGQHSAIPPSLYGEMASASIQAWAREAKDRVLQVAVEDLLEAFCRQDSTEAAVHSVLGAMPVIANLLQTESSKAGDGGVVKEATLDFVAALVKGANADVLQQTQTAIVDHLFPGLFALLQSNSDDRDFFHAAARVLSVLIGKCPEVALSWRGGDGSAAIHHILDLVSKMISPDDISESGGLAVGDLLIVLLRRRPDVVAEQLPVICRALLTRLATATSTSLIQSLIIPLAFLMKDHLSTVVGLVLDHNVQLPGGQTQTALQVLMRKWLEYAGSVQGFWNGRVSTLGICAVFEARATIAALSEQIDGLLVDGDLIPDDSNIIKTRSRARQMPDKYTQIPLPAKMIKVVVAEMRQATDGPPRRSSNGAGDGEDGEEALTDDEDDDWGDDGLDGGGNAGKGRSAFLSDMLGEDFDGDLEDLLHEADEEQFKDDEIWNMHFQSYLVAFFRRIAQDRTLAGTWAPYLNGEEMKALSSIV